MNSFRILSLLLLLLLGVAGGCTFYESREVSFQPPTQYANMQMIGGAQIAAEAYADKKLAKQMFGFDIRDAGLLPVQVIVDSLGDERLEVVADQTFLIDQNGRYWNLLDRKTAYQRVEESSEYGTIAKGAGKGGFLGAAGGALVGAAIGILAGENVAETMGKGAAVGAAGGAIVGGTKEGTSDDSGRMIARDLANKQLENRIIEPGNLTRGFLFFPGEAPGAQALRIQFRNPASGQLYNLQLAL